MKTRSLVALCGSFGYELDPRNLTTEELAEIRRYIELHKKLSPIVIQGDLYRLWSPFTSDSAAWMFVTQDKSEAVAIAVNLRREVGRLLPRLTLRGLAPNKVYQVEELCPGHVVRNIDTGAIDFDSSGVYQFGTPLRMSGRALCCAGLPVRFLWLSCLHGQAVPFCVARAARARVLAILVVAHGRWCLKQRPPVFRSHAYFLSYSCHRPVFVCLTPVALSGLSLLLLHRSSFCLTRTVLSTRSRLLLARVAVVPAQRPCCNTC